jgi:hypothetical protein
LRGGFENIYGIAFLATDAVEMVMKNKGKLETLEGQ